MQTLWIDTETWSLTPLKDGVHKYAEAVEVMVVSYAIDGGPVSVWDVTADREMPLDLEAALDSSCEIWAHNVAFDRTVLKASLGVDPALERWRCSMCLAYMHSMPGGLDALCSALDVAQDKRKLGTGKKLVRRFCIPPGAHAKDQGRATRETHPAEWAEFLEYAGVDIVAMRECVRILPKWNLNPSEIELWQLDRTINERGVAVDLEFCAAALEESDNEKARLAKRTVEMTAGDVQAATQRDALLKHLLKQYGVELPDMQAGTIERRVNDESLPEAVRELLAIRLQASSTSVSKYKSFLRATNSDGRLRGTLQFGGAGRTNRWAGRLVQLHNMSRVPKYLKSRYDFAVEVIKNGSVDLVFENAMEVIGSTVRAALVAKPGHKFCRADLSNIEGRALAWLAGENWKTKAFADGEDLYVLGYSRSFGVPIAEVEADEEAGGTMRLIGKVQELALGFGGAVGAFGSMAQLYGVNLDENRILEIVRAWRAANPQIASFWYELEDTAMRAITSPNLTLDCRMLKVRRAGQWLRIRLPSGRCLCYPMPRYNPQKWVEADGKRVKTPDGGITFTGLNPYTRRYERLQTYGGRLVENVVQATARDVFAECLKRVERAGYPIVLHVHDEIIAETPDTEEFSGERVAELMSVNPPWADGLPLAAEGSETKRYRK